MPRSMGPRPPQLPHAWSLMGKMMMKPFQGTLYPYDPISGHTSRCTTGSWRTPCQAPSSRPSRSPRPCKRANGSPSTSIYGSKWDVSYLSIIYIYIYIAVVSSDLTPKKTIKKPTKSSKSSTKSHPKSPKKPCQGDPMGRRTVSQTRQVAVDSTGLLLAFGRLLSEKPSMAHDKNRQKRWGAHGIIAIWAIVVVMITINCGSNDYINDI